MRVTAKPRRNGGPPTVEPTDEQTPLVDAIIIHSADGGRSFSFAIPPDCGISPFAWPSVLRRTADRLEEQLKTSP